MSGDSKPIRDLNPAGVAHQANSIRVSVEFCDQDHRFGLLTFRSSWEQEAMPLLQKIREAIKEVSAWRAGERSE